MHDAEQFRELASRCRTLAQVASEPDVIEQLKVWAVEFGNEAEAAERCADLRSVQDEINTGSALGRFFFHVIAALAALERDLLRERVHAGLTAAKAPRQRRMRKLTKRQLEYARALLAGRAVTMTEVAARLKIGRSTLYRALAR
jgi:DNA invertase Pin-like site-specific DNA recombinase